MSRKFVLTTSDSAVNIALQQSVARVPDCQLEWEPSLAASLALLGSDAAPVAWLVHLDQPGMAETVLEYLSGSAPADRRRLPVLVIGEVDSPLVARDFVQAGAVEYFSRPLDLGRIALVLDLATVSAMRSPQSVRRARPTDAAYGASPDGMIVDLTMTDLITQVRAVARMTTTVLVSGETGTGKTCLAQAIHRWSPRRDEPFVVVNCGSLAPNLAESELFGHQRGAFTGADSNREGKFAAAGRGTLFLDEIDALSLEIQAKLLRAVDEFRYEPLGTNHSRPLEARLVVATNRDLEAEVEAGRFRRDLLYRINVVRFRLPPLRDRRATIRPLTEHFMREFAQRNQIDPLSFDDTAWQQLETYDWPGNARELRNVVEYAASLAIGARITVNDLPDSLRGPEAQPSLAGEMAVITPRENLQKRKARAEVQIIQEVLNRHRDNRTRAAQELGISRVALYKKLHRYGIA